VPTTADTAQLAAVVDHLDQTIANGDPDQSKALLRLLIAELRVNSRNEIQPTYRVPDPAVCAQTTSVELAGLERVGGRVGSGTGTVGLVGRSPAPVGVGLLRGASVRGPAGGVPLTSRWRGGPRRR
jgi:hypothetical protein